MISITNLRLTTNASFGSLIHFDPEIKEYDVEVPTDCSGALLCLEYNPEFYISVRSDHDAGRFGYADLNPDLGDYIAGNEIPYYDYYGGYIIRLDKREACYAYDLEANLTIDVGSTHHGTDRYMIHIHRDSGQKLRALFEEGSFFDEEFGITMPYLIYVPRNYDSTKRYPLVTCLHGTGEIQESITAILKKTQMATVFAQDSEDGLRECIVLVPKCGIRYDEDDNWITLNQFIHQRSDSPFWPMPQLTVAWRLIEKTLGEYSIDDNRLYLTGISSGAYGAYALAMDHPRDFAALVAISGSTNPHRIESLRHVPLWIFHAADDPVIVPERSLNPMLAALDEAGITYRLTVYPPKQVFWMSGHFCWEAAYKDEEMREWMFSQVNDARNRPSDKASTHVDSEPLEHKTGGEVDDVVSDAKAAASNTDSI